MGSSKVGAGAYRGIAPGVKVVNVKVLDNDGRGTASHVITGLDWVVSNKSTYNIRVINLSLGTIAKDSYTTDPLCLAARRAVNAGLVVVASAGNNGKDLSGKKIYGAINAPGNDPSVITVGAINTYGTDARSDDTVATYSSRGPSRSYTVVNGVRKYDNLVKPDLVAPGNKIIGARSNNFNNDGNKLTAAYPGLLTGNTTISRDALMYMSGTSMAALVVAGAAALLLQANSTLAPSLVKAILMYTAQPLKGFNTLEQGTGALNIDGAVRMARLVKTTLPTTSGAALLTGSLPTSQTSTIVGQTIT
jgi:subtilisin family serine protease